MKLPDHIALIPDGNRRFARKNRISLRESYTLGVKKGLEVIKWCQKLGIKDISFFGASLENIQERPEHESLAILQGVLEFCKAVMDLGIHLRLFGDTWERRLLNNPYYQEHILPRLPPPDSRKPREPAIYVGVVYSPKSFLEDKGTRYWDPSKDGSLSVPPIDLVIRTGNRYHLSGFLPIQIANAEIKFERMLWKEFRKNDFDRVIRWYARQPRTFGL